MEDQLIAQIADKIGGLDLDRAVVEARNLVVATRDGVRAFLIHCLTAATTTFSMSPVQRLDYLSQLYPDLATRMAGGQMLVIGDATGEQLAIAMCAMQVFPFYFDAERTDVLSLDDPLWKMVAMMELSAAVVPAPAVAAAGTATPTSVLDAPPVEPVDVQPRRARVPLQMLVSLVRMDGDIGVTVDFLRSFASETVPRWLGIGGTSLDAAVGSRDVLGSGVRLHRLDTPTRGTRALFARYDDSRAVNALMRAVIAVEHARDYADNDVTLASLPRVIDWDVHRVSDQSQKRALDGIYFSVIYEHHDAPAVDIERVKPLAAALYAHLDVYWTRSIAGGNVVQRDGVQLQLPLFLGARTALLDRPSRRSTPALWLRRSTALAGADWLALSSADSQPLVVDPASEYSFRMNRAVAPMAIAAALAVNDTCRECGTKLGPMPSALWCPEHVQCALAEE